MGPQRECNLLVGLMNDKERGRRVREMYEEYVKKLALEEGVILLEERVRLLERNNAILQKKAAKDKSDAVRRENSTRRSNDGNSKIWEKR